MNLLKFITPVNLSEEKEKFFTDHNYHPIFKYIWNDNKVVIKKDDYKSRLLKSILLQDTSEIINSARKYFQVENFDYLDESNKILKETPNQKKIHTLADFKFAYEEAFQIFGLKDYKLEIVDTHGFNFRPIPKEKKIYMSRHANFQFFDPEGEVRHELVHIIRYENGKHNGIKKSLYYLPTEEGLATYMHDTGVSGQVSVFQHAAEYVASKVGLEGSLRDVFEFFINKGFTPELAWQRASRHKFGFVNTKESGDILKPAMYFENFMKLKNLTHNEIIRLFVGKISVSEIEKYPEYKGFVDEEILRKYYGIGL